MDQHVLVWTRAKWNQDQDQAQDQDQCQDQDQPQDLDQCQDQDQSLEVEVVLDLNQDQDQVQALEGPDLGRAMTTALLTPNILCVCIRDHPLCVVPRQMTED